MWAIYEGRRVPAERDVPAVFKWGDWLMGLPRRVQPSITTAPVTRPRMRGLICLECLEEIADSEVAVAVGTTPSVRIRVRLDGRFYHQKCFDEKWNK